MPGKFPTVYVRGFAGGGRSIDEAVEDPLYGCNLGSTQVRVGLRGNPRYYQFESPLLRLLTEHGYDLKVEGGQEAFLDRQADGAVARIRRPVHATGLQDGEQGVDCASGTTPEAARAALAAANGG